METGNIGNLKFSHIRHQEKAKDATREDTNSEQLELRLFPTTTRHKEVQKILKILFPDT